MDDTDLHTLAIIKLRQILENYLAQRLDAYVSGNLMMYDVEGPGRTAVSSRSVSERRTVSPIKCGRKGNLRTS